MVTVARSCPALAPDPLQAQFLNLLPKIQEHARIYFRHVLCADQKADKIAETVALAWKWLVRLHERRKDVSRFPMVFVFLVAKAVSCGRRATGVDSARDVLSPLAQRRHVFNVESLSRSQDTQSARLAGVDGGIRFDGLEERLHGNTRTTVVDQVVFRIDFRAWLATLTARERKIIRVMMLNERTRDLARTFGVSPGRISQIRHDFKKGWRSYCGDDTEFQDRPNRREKTVPQNSVASDGDATIVRMPVGVENERHNLHSEKAANGKTSA
jgi:hypothetical protein